MAEGRGRKEGRKERQWKKMRRKLEESEVKRRQSWMDLMQAYGDSICITFSPSFCFFPQRIRDKRKERMRDKKKEEREDEKSGM